MPRIHSAQDNLNATEGEPAAGQANSSFQTFCYPYQLCASACCFGQCRKLPVCPAFLIFCDLSQSHNLSINTPRICGEPSLISGRLAPLCLPWNLTIHLWNLCPSAEILSENATALLQVGPRRHLAGHLVDKIILIYRVAVFIFLSTTAGLGQSCLSVPGTSTADPCCCATLLATAIGRWRGSRWLQRAPWGVHEPLWRILILWARLGHWPEGTQGVDPTFELLCCVPKNTRRS